MSNWWYTHELPDKRGDDSYLSITRIAGFMAAVCHHILLTWWEINQPDLYTRKPKISPYIYSQHSSRCQLYQASPIPPDEKDIHEFPHPISKHQMNVANLIYQIENATQQSKPKVQPIKISNYLWCKFLFSLQYCHCTTQQSVGAFWQNVGCTEHSVH